MSKKEYKKFLDSPQWKEFRKSVYKIFQYECWFCKCRNLKLNLHHTNYYKTTVQKVIDIKKFPYNRLRWFLVVCDDCHSNIHKIAETENVGVYTATKTFRDRYFPSVAMWMRRKKAKFRYEKMYQTTSPIGS